MGTAMEQFDVREATPGEYADAGTATARAYDHILDSTSPEQAEYRERIADVSGRATSHVVFVALVGHRVVGSASVELVAHDGTAPEAGFIRMVGIHPDYQGRGLGRRLVEACIDRCRQDGKRTVALRTMAAMQVAQALYASMGFTPDADDDISDSSWGTLFAYRLTLT